MNLLYPRPIARHNHQQGNRKMVTLLLWGGLLWVSTLFLLLLPALSEDIALPGTGWPAWMYIARYTVALVDALLLGLLAGATLAAQSRGRAVPAWVSPVPALLLAVLLWCVL